MKKTLTIYQMSPDSIDVEDKIEIEVWYNEGAEARNTHWERTPDPNTPNEITSIEYEGTEVSHLIGTMFSDDEILNAQTDLETEEGISEIRKINLIEQ